MKFCEVVNDIKCITVGLVGYSKIVHRLANVIPEPPDEIMFKYETNIRKKRLIFEKDNKFVHDFEFMFPVHQYNLPSSCTKFAYVDIDRSKLTVNYELYVLVEFINDTLIRMDDVRFESKVLFQGKADILYYQIDKYNQDLVFKLNSIGSRIFNKFRSSNEIDKISANFELEAPNLVYVNKPILSQFKLNMITPLRLHESNHEFKICKFSLKIFFDIQCYSIPTEYPSQAYKKVSIEFENEYFDLSKNYQCDPNTKSYYYNHQFDNSERSDISLQNCEFEKHLFKSNEELENIPHVYVTNYNTHNGLFTNKVSLEVAVTLQVDNSNKRKIVYKAKSTLDVI